MYDVNKWLERHPRPPVPPEVCQKFAIAPNSMWFDWRNTSWNARALYNGKTTPQNVWGFDFPEPIRDEFNTLVTDGTLAPENVPEMLTKQSPELVALLNSWRLDGVVMSNDQHAVDSQALGKDHLLFNVCVEGFVATNNNARLNC